MSSLRVGTYVVFPPLREFFGHYVTVDPGDGEKKPGYGRPEKTEGKQRGDTRIINGVRRVDRATTAPANGRNPTIYMHAFECHCDTSYYRLWTGSSVRKIYSDTRTRRAPVAYD